jgi:lipoprotein-anchoring transpeptidase ErfK/SrfK
VYQDVYEKAAHDVRAPATVGLGRHAERNKDLLKARELYREAVKDATPDSREWNDALDALGKVNVALVFSHQETPESKWYTVAKGDSITSIGNALNTTQGMLMRANGIDESTVLSTGQRLIYTPKDFRIVIERSRRRLFLLDKDGVFKRYSVGLGKPGHETTLGSYKIGNKEKNPVWHKPGVGPIPSGDPANELGTRWMPFVPDQEGLPKDLGIHGTIRPETVGQYSSNGCVRLYPEDVEELYDLVVRSTPVDIVETFSLDKGVTIASPDSGTTGEAKS